VTLPTACKGTAHATDAPTALCELQFDGIDTSAEIRVDGHVVGVTRNMFRVYRVPVSGAGPVTLEVEIEPATVYAARVAAANGDENCTTHNRGLGPGSWPEKWGHGTICSLYVRKNTGSFGWDCAPACVHPTFSYIAHGGVGGGGRGGIHHEFLLSQSSCIVFALARLQNMTRDMYTLLPRLLEELV
jgi:hypothetical protein